MKDPVRERYGAQVEGLLVLGVLVAIMWAVEIVNALDSALRRRYRRAQAAAGVQPLRFHDLRHTFGSRC